MTQNNNTIPTLGPLVSITGIVVFRLRDSQISDYQQSLSLRPFRGAFPIPPARLVVADLEADRVAITDGFNLHHAVINHAGI